MRKNTLMFILLCIVFPPVYFSREMLTFVGFPNLVQHSRAIVALVAMIFASVVLGLLNPRILNWRKARGRDIEEEERYESDHGMISLTPKDRDPEN